MFRQDRQSEKNCRFTVLRRRITYCTKEKTGRRSGGKTLSRQGKLKPREMHYGARRKTPGNGNFSKAAGKTEKNF
jgi:hypothetical protein